jgi:hypothetical protein
MWKNTENQIAVVAIFGGILISTSQAIAGECDLSFKALYVRKTEGGLYRNNRRQVTLE